MAGCARTIITAPWHKTAEPNSSKRVTQNHSPHSLTSQPRARRFARNSCAGSGTAGWTWLMRRAPRGPGELKRRLAVDMNRIAITTPRHLRTAIQNTFAERPDGKCDPRPDPTLSRRECWPGSCPQTALRPGLNLCRHLHIGISHPSDHTACGGGTRHPVFRTGGGASPGCLHQYHRLIAACRMA